MKTRIEQNQSALRIAMVEVGLQQHMGYNANHECYHKDCKNNTCYPLSRAYCRLHYHAYEIANRIESVFGDYTDIECNASLNECNEFMMEFTKVDQERSTDDIISKIGMEYSGYIGEYQQFFLKDLIDAVKEIIDFRKTVAVEPRIINTFKFKL